MNKKDVIISSNKTESADEEANPTDDENSQIINKPYSKNASILEIPKSGTVNVLYIQNNN